MPNPQRVVRSMRRDISSARELFIRDVSQANKAAMIVANDIKGAIGEVSIVEAKTAVLKEFEKVLNNE